MGADPGGLWRWTLTLHTVTPAFVGGARPRQVDEVTPLRPASIRGVLRHWFRLGMAALIRPADGRDTARSREDLHQVEAALFGSTEAASRVVILPPRGGRITPMAAPDPKAAPGQRYLGYGIFEGKGGAPTCLMADEKNPVKLTVALRGRARTPQEVQEASLAAGALAACLWLWCNLGGIGARTRRGWGGLRVVSVEPYRGGPQLPWAGPPLQAEPEGLAGLLQHVDQGIAAAQKALASFARHHLKVQAGQPLSVKGSRPDPALRTLAALTELRALPATFGAASEAMDAAGRLFQDYRSTLRRNALGLPPLADYFEVKGVLAGRQSAPRDVRRAAFGLPLPFYFRSLGGAKGVLRPAIRGADRMPSPLLFRVHRLKGGRHAVLMLNLAEGGGARPLAHLDVELSPRQVEVPGPDGQILVDFMKWAAAEARLRYPEK